MRLDPKSPLAARAKPAVIRPAGGGVVVGEGAGGLVFRPTPENLDRLFAEGLDVAHRLAKDLAPMRLHAEAREANGLQAGITLPLRLGRGQNDRGLDKWRRARTAKRREAARQALALMKPVLEFTVTRIAPSPGLDPTDNLPASMKELIDELAAYFGFDDGDERVKFTPAQERGPWNVRIEVRLVGRAR